MIRLKNLTKIYKKGKHEVTALKNINLEVSKGSIHGIIGLSGAGKSSLIRCINRLEEPTSGEIWIDGINLMSLNNKNLRNARKRMGMIFQGFNLLWSKTVFDNIAFPLKLSRLPEAQIKERVISLLELVELSDKANSYPSQLSGGQKQRVGIARALANEPNILLCDEATSALDPKTTKQILTLLKSINQSLGITVIVVTHEMDVIKEICDYVTILEGGEIIEEGNTIDVFSKPSNEITKHFVESPNYLPKDLVDDITMSLSFMKGSAKIPIISKLIKEFDIDVNILSGQIEYIQNEPLGKLTIGISNISDNLDDIISYFESNNVKVEVITNE
ncbi:methionine ABC transporter ATP-binding protein [Paramaledivibacter caminithermalis]|uniref:D-methionine transport system ATP-binding protein n=1 Tax=Paramaledivibacter caminithermalis (strain DSM 15212 / CIP 107654 / DViRD3) TaxID=1121301 RepID=A0A1M6LS46_PARC5|nr:ATP-binding cassette domain-containing protein [Paramaledivibacter caminithermalis]SHJ74010.1 D-methionine transport system ATP-binding protein [Paramaledivibacter caminithermalis DSM 15212]